jgi:hypothetical protein
MRAAISASALRGEDRDVEEPSESKDAEKCYERRHDCGGDAAGRWLAAGRLDSHLGGARTLILPGRIGPATRESA